MLLQKQTMTKNTAVFMASIIVQKAMTLGYFVLIANVFAPSQQGLYSAALAFTTLFGVLADMGIAAVLVRETAQRGKAIELFVQQTFLSRIILGILVYVIMIGGAWLFQYPFELIQLIAIAGIAAVIDTCSTTSWAIVRGFHNLKYEALGGVLAIVVMVAIGGFAIFLHQGIFVLMFGVLAGSGANFALALWVLKRRIGLSLISRFQFSVMKQLFTMSLPFAAAAVCSRIYTYGDMAILVKFAGEQSVGWYAAASKLLLALNLIPSSVSASLYPTLSEASQHDPGIVGSKFARAFFFIALIAFPIATGLWVLASDIVRTFYNENYLPTILIMQILSIALLFNFLTFPFGALLAATNRQNKNTLLYAIAALISIAGNVALTPHYGAVGSALVAIAVPIVICVGSALYSFRLWRENARMLGWQFAGIIIATTFMGLAISAIHSYVHLILSVAAGMVAYAGAVWVLGIFTMNDIKRVRRSF